MSMIISMGISNPNIGTGNAKDLNGSFHCLTISYSAVCPVNPNGVATGTPSMSPITVVVPASNGPALLSSLLLARTHTVTFDLEKSSAVSGTQGTIYETIVLTDAIVTLFQETCSAGDTLPTLEISFAYRELTFTEPGTDGGGTVTYRPGQGKLD